MARARKRKLTARTLAVEAARIASDNRGEDVLVLDLRGISPVTDFFVIFTGTSDRQMRSAAEEIVDAAARSDWKLLNRAGLDSAKWVLLDFVDVVVHVFDVASRKYYDLELIWGDAPRVRWKPRATPAREKKDDPGPSQ